MTAVASRKIQSRVPGEIQAVADRIIEDAGLTISDVVRMLMTRIAKDKAIPPVLFQPNAETLAAFAEVERGELEPVTLDQISELIRAAQAE
ncbi:MAG: type II toxin-antitoxin system RelB/DinJ family antitoxin [Desulfobulbus sp.]|nr:type II toxin-antitoxin system RelB/DinJ family antitoxin [Desulfobulbus sp.]